MLLWKGKKTCTYTGIYSRVCYKRPDQEAHSETKLFTYESLSPNLSHPMCASFVGKFLFVTGTFRCRPSGSPSAASAALWSHFFINFLGSPWEPLLRYLRQNKYFTNRMRGFLWFRISKGKNRNLKRSFFFVCSNLIVRTGNRTRYLPPL